MSFLTNHSKNKIYKRSQIEIVGLLIIVLMISFIILFAVRSFSNKSRPISDSIRMEILASDMISAMLHTSTTCTPYSPDMSDILIECAKWKDSGSVAKCTNGKSYCDFFEDTAKKMFDETFKIWSYSYDFIIVPPSGSLDNNFSWLMNFSGGDFSKSNNIRSGLQPLSTGADNLVIYLSIGK
jgi:hypothetical protein